MIKVINNKYGSEQQPCPIERFLDERLQESRLNSYEEPISFEVGNFLPLLKLITEKLHTAKMVSDQELLEALGGGYTWHNTFFKADD